MAYAISSVVNQLFHLNRCEPFLEEKIVTNKHRRTKSYCFQVLATRLAHVAYEDEWSFFIDVNATFTCKKEESPRVSVLCDQKSHHPTWSRQSRFSVVSPPETDMNRRTDRDIECLLNRNRAIGWVAMKICQAGVGKACFSIYISIDRGIWRNVNRPSRWVRFKSTIDNSLPSAALNRTDIIEIPSASRRISIKNKSNG